MSSPVSPPLAGVQGASPSQGPAQVNKGVVAGAVGQWQGLPRAQQGGGGGTGQRPSWQTLQGGLRSTGLAGNGGSGGGGPTLAASAGQAAAGSPQQQGGAAPWQQGAAGLRRTGLVVAGEGGGGGGGGADAGGLDMGKLSLNSGQPQWRT